MEFGYILGVVGVAGIAAWLWGNRCEHYYGTPHKDEHDRLVQRCYKCDKKRRLVG